jgi:TRAP-type C4-dicarboxylate transport system substrate-binding protein
MAYRTKLITAAVSAAAISLLLSLPAASQSIIKIGSPTIKESVHHWMLSFEKRIAKRAGKKFEVKVFPLSQLGTILRMIEGAQFGTIELAMLPPADEAEFRKRMSTVGDAVMKDKPEVREMYELMKKIAARHLNG